MKINKDELKTALEIVRPGLAKKEKIEQSTSFVFYNGRVITYNDEISISHPISHLELKLKGAILAENLYKFLDKVRADKDGNIEFEVSNNEIIITSGRAKAGLTLQAEIKLPLNEEITEKGEWKLLPEGFTKAVKFALGSCSSDASQPILTCIHITKNGIIESTDNYRITRTVLKEDIPIQEFLLPAQAALEVVKLDPKEIAEGKGWIHFRTPLDSVISCRIIKEHYLNVEEHLDIQGTRIILPKSTSEVLDRAMVFAKRDNILAECVMVSLSNKRLKMRAESDSGWFEEELNMSYEGDPISFAITPYLMKDILSETLECVVDKKITKLKFEGEGWQYLTLLRTN